MKNHSKIIKCSNYEWKSVPKKEYKDDTQCYDRVHRYSLLGEGEDEQQLNFHTRYFEVKPGGYTSFEHHRHPHSVVVIRGSGHVILGNEIYELGLHDVVFVASDTPHQFHAGKKEPLGFICIVDRYRDRPSIPDDEAVEKMVPSKKVRNNIRR